VVKSCWKGNSYTSWPLVVTQYWVFGLILFLCKSKFWISDQMLISSRDILNESSEGRWIYVQSIQLKWNRNIEDWNEIKVLELWMDPCVVNMIEMNSKYYELKWYPMIVIENHVNDVIDIEILYDNIWKNSYEWLI